MGSKTTVSFNLETDTIKELDELAAMLGMSRSATTQLILGGVLSGDAAKVVQTLITSALANRDKAGDSDLGVVTA